MLRSPLGHARGLGAAKAGVEHWWAQRLTALALVPLTGWFVVSVIINVGAPHGDALAWIGNPVHAVLLVLLVAGTFHHAQLGLQVVIEDYVHAQWLKLTSVILVKAAAVVLALAVIFAVLLIAFGGAR